MDAPLLPCGQWDRFAKFGGWGPPYWVANKSVLSQYFALADTKVRHAEMAFMPFHTLSYLTVPYRTFFPFVMVLLYGQLSSSHGEMRRTCHFACSPMPSGRPSMAYIALSMPWGDWLPPWDCPYEGNRAWQAPTWCMNGQEIQNS